jgi:hypothetical protein
MAQAAGKQEARERSKTVVTVVSMIPGPSRDAARQELKEESSTWPLTPKQGGEDNQWASHAVRSAKQTFSELYATTRRRASEAYGDVYSASRNLTTRVRHSANQVKEEHPLQILAVIAGSAVVLGVAARIWRSRRHA